MRTCFIPLGSCHILEFWLSPTPMISGHLQCHLQSCVAMSRYTRKVIMLDFTNIDNLYVYIFVFYNSCTLDATTPSKMNSLFSIDTLYSLQTLFVIYSPIYFFVYSFTLV